MKKIIASIMILCMLSLSFISNASIVKADVCPGYEDGEHRWTEWELYWSEDCSEGFIYKRYCTGCLQEQYGQAQPTSHVWGKWHITKATVFKKGEKWHECDNCLQIQTVTIRKKKMTKNQRKAYKVVKRYLKAAKKYKWKKMNKCFANKKCYEGYPTYKPLVKQYRRLNKRMSWKMIDIKGKGKKLTVSANVKIPNMYKSIYEAYEDNIYYAAKYGGYSSEELGDSIIDDYAYNLKHDSVKMKNMKVNFKMIKTKKGWKIKKKTIRMVDLATCRYAIGTSDAELDFNIDFED